MDSKGGDVGDNGGMTCGAVDESDVEALGANGVDDGGNIISSVDLHACRPARPPPFPRPRIGCILTVMDDIGGLRDDPYDVDALLSEEM